MRLQSHSIKTNIYLYHSELLSTCKPVHSTSQVNMNNLFNFGSSSGQKPANDGASRAIPSNWYRSPAMYELERRAIYSKKWIVVTHQLRFKNPGDFVQFQEAGFNFFIVKDRKGSINAFHNICRHRAYPVVEKDSGSVGILACKYHGEFWSCSCFSFLEPVRICLRARLLGWSYGLDGKLAKAPRYDDVEGFNKENNNLFPIHVHVDKLGFVWVNLEAKPTPSVAWADDFAGVDTQERLQQFDMTQYHFDHQWDMIGDYNWKTLADNYNEVIRSWQKESEYQTELSLHSATTVQRAIRVSTLFPIFPSTGLKPRQAISNISTPINRINLVWGYIARSTSLTLQSLFRTCYPLSQFRRSH